MKQDVNAQDADGVTALILASNRRDMEIVDRLIEAGADVDALKERWKTIFVA